MQSNAIRRYRRRGSHMKATIQSLLVGAIQPLAGTSHLSGIDKHPTHDRLWLGTEGVTGDQQADRRHHGGPDKAVHHYAFDHYPFWTAEIGSREVLSRPGAFGENLSTTGITEEDICIGDIFTLGSATVQVSQARQPCWKLNKRFDFPGMSRLVQQTGKTGWYYRVLEPGSVATGSDLTLLERKHPEWPLAKILEVLYRNTLDAAALESLSGIEAFPASWRELFKRRLQALEVEDWARRLDGVSSQE